MALAPPPSTPAHSHRRRSRSRRGSHAEAEAVTGAASRSASLSPSPIPSPRLSPRPNPLQVAPSAAGAASDDVSEVYLLRAQVSHLQQQLVAERAWTQSMIEQMRAEWMTASAAGPAVAASASFSSTVRMRSSSSSYSSSLDVGALDAPLQAPPSPSPSSAAPCTCGASSHRSHASRRARWWHGKFSICTGCLVLLPLLLLGSAFLYYRSRAHWATYQRWKQVHDKARAKMHLPEVHLPAIKTPESVQRAQAKWRDWKGDTLGKQVAGGGTNLAASEAQKGGLLGIPLSAAPITQLLAQTGSGNTNLQPAVVAGQTLLSGTGGSAVPVAAAVSSTLPDSTPPPSRPV